VPKLANLRHDPFELTIWPEEGIKRGSIGYWGSFKHEMWRFQIPDRVIAQCVPILVSIRRCRLEPASTSAI
jgi:hypothetical protein